MKSVTIYNSLFISLLVFVSSAQADWSGSRPDGHAPIGVMGEHTHEEGEVMLSYRFMFMEMDGNRDGTSGISTSRVLEDFMVSPTEMDMEMHMFGAMFASRDWLTTMIMIPYVELSMNHVTRSGATFETTSSGLGDIKITNLINVFEIGDHKIHLNAGVSLPSGEIDERDDIPVMAQAKLPYPMQLGSGTFDLLPGATYLGQTDNFSWGLQGIGTVRLGRNDNDYSLGNRFDATTWVAARINDLFSSSLRLAWAAWGNVEGADSDLNPMMVPTADPNRRGGDQLDLGIGLNFYVPKGSLSSSRLAIEWLFPLQRDLDGPQLETDWNLVAGWQMAF